MLETFPINLQASARTRTLMPQFARSGFDHIGLVTDEVKPGESWVEATRVWVTSPREHPYNVEWLRFEPDSPVTGPLRTEPHVAYRVDDVHAADRGSRGAGRALRRRRRLPHGGVRHGRRRRGRVHAVREPPTRRGGFELRRRRQRSSRSAARRRSMKRRRAPSTRSTTSRSTSQPASWSAFSGRAAAGRRRCSGRWRGCTP